jgi:hypothetical protein
MARHRVPRVTSRPTIESFGIRRLPITNQLSHRRFSRRIWDLLLGLFLFLALALALTVSISTAGAQEKTNLAAGMIASDTPEGVRIRGSDAIAGTGDWFLSNGTLCAAVLGTEHHGILIPGGGSLVDLGHCGRDDDQFIGLDPIYNLSRKEMFRVLRIESHVDDTRAQIVTHARDGGLTLTTRYSLDLEQPDRVTVHSSFVRDAEGPRLFAIGDILLHAENALRNFILNDGGEYSGFRHVSREDSSYLDIASSIRSAAGTVLVGSDGQGPQVSYLYRPLESSSVDTLGESSPLDHFTLGFSSVTVTNLGTRPALFPSLRPGPLQAVQYLWMDIPLGERLEFRRELRVSKRADVASLSDRVYSNSLSKSGEPGGPVQVTGSIDDPDARVHVFRTGEGATSHITMARPAASGRFAFVVPRGSYRLEILAPAGRRLIREIDANDPEGVVDLGSIELTPAARVTLPRGAPMRLVFEGLGDTPDPAFGDDLSGLTLGGLPKANSQKTRDVHLAGADHDPDSILIAPGQYQVYATRGPEFSLTRAKLSLAAGEHKALEIPAPERVFDTPGWISADFHVHASPSFDSTLPQTQRLRSFVAEGGEVLVATDHDAVSEYVTLIKKLELGDRLTSLSGIEVTTTSPTPNNPSTTGHINVFPVPYRPELNRAGAMQDEGRRLREIISLARAFPQPTIVQLNHPRRPDKPLHHGAFLDHMSVAGAPFEPSQPIESPANRSLIEVDPQTGLRDVDFDAIELLNGQSTDRYRLIQQDWFSLLSQGYRVTGMANSDTHNVTGVVSMPRNYIRMTRDKVKDFDRSAFIAAALGGHVYGTTGPLLDVMLGEAGPGDVFSGNRANLSITVRAAPWVPVSVLRIYRDGGLSREVAITGSAVESFEMTFDRDAYIVVEVEGRAAGDYAAILPEFTPLAYSNPIFVDADRDGVWTPPGLNPR